MSLSSWPEARLSIHWRAAQRQIACAALLAVGEDGPDPTQALRSAGWKAWTLPKSLGSTFANSALPTALPFPRAWSQAPTLLCPEAVLSHHEDVLAEAGATLLVPQECENIDALH